MNLTDMHEDDGALASEHEWRKSPFFKSGASHVEIVDDISDDSISFVYHMSNSNTEESDDGMSFDEKVEFLKHRLKENPHDEQVVSRAAEMIVCEIDKERINTLFELIASAVGKDGSFFASLGSNAYESGNNAVAEKAFIRAVKYTASTDPASVVYKNNLAYLHRRHAIAEGVSAADSRNVPILLREGVKQREAFSLINMALFWSLQCGKESDWELADRLIGTMRIGNDADKASVWWSKLAEEGDAEGFLVHLLLLRHGKIRSSLLGDINQLYKISKQAYPKMPSYYGEKLINQA